MLSVSTHNPLPQLFAEMPSTLTRTVTIVGAIPQTSHHPVKTLPFPVSDASHYLDRFEPFERFDTFSGPWWEIILLLIIVLIAADTACLNLGYVARYIDMSFRKWLDVAPSPGRSLKARVVFWFMIAVYLATLTNIGLLIFEQTIQLKDLVLSSGQQHVGLTGPEWWKALLATAGVLIAHLLQSSTAFNLVKYRRIEERRPDAVLLEPRWWGIVILGLFSLHLAEFSAGVLGYNGALALVVEATAAKVV